MNNEITNQVYEFFFKNYCIIETIENYIPTATSNQIQNNQKFKVYDTPPGSE